MPRFRLAAGLLAVAVAGLHFGTPFISGEEPARASYSVSVTPDNNNEAVRDAGSFFFATFTVTNTGTQTDTYGLEKDDTGNLACTIPDPLADAPSPLLRPRSRR